MRPINLIPPDDQAGRAQARAGALSYVVLGALAAILLAVTLTVLTSNRISDAESQVATLEQERDAAQARAASLSAFAEFRNMQEQRTATVVSLAQSRFDWERVLRELALVLPEDIWLIELEGTVSPSVAVSEGAGVDLRDGVPGPALEIIGCGVSHDSVGGLVAALRDIDGVTRVTVAKAERPELTEASGSGGSAVGDDGECRTQDFITRFEIVAAFDEVPAPAAAPEGVDPAAPAAPTDTGTAVGEPSATAPVGDGAAETQGATEAIPGG
jgi:Tfp pilus assembly protein PilN